MIKTLQIALAPLLTIGSFCGVRLFEYPPGHPRSHLSCLYVLVIWSFLTYSIYYPIYAPVILHIMQLPMDIVTFALMDIMILITMITTILVNIFYFKVKSFTYIVLNNLSQIIFITYNESIFFQMYSFVCSDHFNTGT
ncbi:hypothetical protein ALC56_13189 [Trachymyrmex septentrionalis]|uniref:Uncharacterized protein n=1 Tax=Trachymyrmex septentrionalis TaxID=34720 RepID=A0A195EWQ6_9HYME|nr:hypothetical protein ALC56_13189 [Trachymyrmex septentrionalis]